MASQKIKSNQIEAGEGWKELPLSGGWINYAAGSFPDAQYRKDQFGMVHVRGLIKNGSASVSTVMAVLPEGYRPAKALHFLLMNNNTFAAGRVDPSGNILLNAAASSNAWIALNSIIFLGEV